MGEFEVHNLAFIPDQESQTMKEKLTEIPLGPVDMVVKAEAGEVAKDGATAPVAGLSGLQYAIDDIPPSHISVFLGLQHFLMMVGGTMIIPLLLSDKLCITNEDPARAYLLSTILFVSGIVTFLQCTLGSRLPIIQGGTFSLILPAFAILDLPENKCPSNADLEAMTDDERAEVWMSRMRIIQGGIILASLVQVFVGFTGLIGYVMKWISPISICPLIALVGLSLFDVAATDASENWGIAAMTIVLLLLFSQYISEWDVPVFPKWNFTTKTFSVTKLKIFKLFPVILTLCTAWLVCYILTVTEALPENDKARTDIKSSILRKSPWIRVPYPFQWGMPRVTASAFIGMLAGVLASAMESIGDYFACARLAGAPPPPTHAINRGIGTEGVGSVLAGMFGSGNGTTSYSENIGAIGITKVGSRRVIQYASFLMVLVAIIGKFAALFSTIPVPILGGSFLVLFGVISAVGLSNLQYVDLDSSRNLLIVGFSIFTGLAVPWWVKNNEEAIDTGVKELDDVIRIFLSTSMVIGGVIAFVLDNTIAGTKEERGLEKWTTNATPASEPDGSATSACYDFPFGMDLLRRHKWTRKLPFSPTYRGYVMRYPRSCKTFMLRRR